MKISKNHKPRPFNDLARRIRLLPLAVRVLKVANEFHTDKRYHIVKGDIEGQAIRIVIVQINDELYFISVMNE